MKILIIGPSWVGDMVMSQSLYSVLKQQHPKSTIDVLAPAWCKPILERMPEVSNALEMPLGHGELEILKRRALGKSLQKNGYDIAYILPNSAKSALIPFFASIPKRVGWKGEFRFGLLNDIRTNKAQFQYMVERYVALAHPKKDMTDSTALGGLDTLPKPRLEVTTHSQNAALAKLQLSLSDNLVAMCPGAEFGPAKKWPTEHYAKVAEAMCSQGRTVWLFGSQNDVDTCEEIKAKVATNYQQQVIVLAGKTSLVEAVDLLAACSTVISNDSGLMHVAAAVGCNVVAVYGSSSPDYTPPLSDKVAQLHTDIECRPCFKKTCKFGHQKCLTELAPERVINAIQELEK
ncbi:lipopolysaccharide heptosyltransferase II [Vibrio sp. SCSIO 43136]|uniref:lipopolysaccharide heptosyltransferase II n=1 Tax=Vibrio sp. SCSIO 43136 TaxID=2819101 RepID=UPI0020758949|nr:lipopolysaccharide heptosyltransferase II [Vibrio sp. SCSIO 43136]USD65137.1 lipopolysaccharide heptosyltransferase II [Vibrio sp. SCSIO 43136]